MSPHNELRLLPWLCPEDKPCYLSTDDNRGYLSRLADNIEATQLGMATDLLKIASALLGDEGAEPDELRLLAADLAVSLRAVHRVAKSRGHRLSKPALPGRDSDDEGLRPPAAAFS
ncbi:hypothetical protein ACIQUY_29615 [Streptomyces sp. NPDC090231]|uniref:hypothetical protein n=1 Tax=unclassified Streptomyces TaxID=2593676 RepID=UPI0038153FFA